MYKIRNATIFSFYMYIINLYLLFCYKKCQQLEECERATLSLKTYFVMKYTSISKLTNIKKV